MSEQTQKQIIDFSIVAAIFVAILTVYVMLSYLIQLKKIKFLHESTVVIIMGILTAVFCKYALKTTISFSNEIFFAIILPPIIFSAGFSLRKSLFFQNIGMICFYGIIGTIIGFILITLILVALNKTIFHCLNLAQIMIIGSVLCATDTVASMTLIKPQKYPSLNAVLFGQSIINDAVAIILFRAVTAFAATKDEEFSSEIVLKMSLSFLYLFFFSMVLGIISGLLLSYIFRRFSFFSIHPIKETSIVLLNGYFTYLLGQIFGLSGIISLFTQSIIIGHYAFMNLSDQSKKATGMAFQTVSYMAQAFIYAYLGASILSISEKWNAALMALGLLIFLPLVRAIMVYLVPCFYRVFRKKFHLNSKELKVCWFAGMIRGVIAFALCLQVESENKEFVTSLVLVVVLFTTVGGSSFLNKFIEIIKLEKQSGVGELQHLNKKQSVDSKPFNEEKDLNFQADLIKETNETQPHRRSKILLKLINFEKNYMRPMFGKTQQSQLNKKYSQSEQSRRAIGSKENNIETNSNKQESSKEQGQQLECMSPTKSRSGSSNLTNWKPFEEQDKKR